MNIPIRNSNQEKIIPNYLGARTNVESTNLENWSPVEELRMLLDKKFSNQTPNPDGVKLIEVRGKQGTPLKLINLSRDVSKDKPQTTDHHKIHKKYSNLVKTVRDTFYTSEALKIEGICKEMGYSREMYQCANYKKYNR